MLLLLIILIKNQLHHRNMQFVKVKFFHLFVLLGLALQSTEAGKYDIVFFTMIKYYYR